MKHCSFGTICERDMDMLFLEAIITDSEFSKFIIDKTELKDKKFKNISIELSKTDAALGESDITWIVETEDGKYGILIEDKIDAIAMEEQYQRYKKRGEKGIARKEYKKYFVFLFSPEKYHENNSEAKKYDYFISYEDHRDFFSQKNDLVSGLRKQQLDFAIKKAKKPSNTTLNKLANSYFRRYSQFQKEHYPTLDLRTRESSNGYWAHYGTRIGKVYLLHKMQEGFADLTFPNTVEDITVLENIVSKLRNMGMDSISAEVTGKSLAIRIRVPKLNMQSDFDETAESNIIKCFDSIQCLIDFANIFDDIKKLVNE